MFSSLVGGTLTAGAVETLAGRYVYPALLEVPSTSAALTGGADNALVAVTFPSTESGDVVQLNDFTGEAGNVNGYWYISYNGFDNTNYNEMFYGTNAINNPGGNSSVDANLPLPVTLASFSATKFEENSSYLRWITATETNTSHFEIERSFNGTDWKNIGQVQAAGYSNDLKEYTFLDLNVYNGRTPSMTAYYRLRTVDLDDHHKFSPIESVQFKNELAGTTPFVAYPNPAREGVTIEWDAYAIGQPTTLELFDAAGKLLLSRDVAPNSTKEYIDFTQAKAATGLCLVRLLAAGEILDVKQIMIGQN